MNILICLLVTLLAGWAVTRFYLRGEDLGRYDGAHNTPHGQQGAPSQGHHEAVRRVAELTGGAANTGSRREQLAFLREKMDELGAGADLEGIELRTVQAGGVPAEWVLAADADPARRLLYLHGGAYTMGSPRSHRAITARLSRIASCAVLAIDYRLMPEHPRRAGIEDCRAAYRWILENGPDGPGAPSALFIAGDSAGGNLTLSTIAWARDAGLRAADAAVALSPATDATLSGPSIARNIESDHMLGPMFGPMTRIPRALTLWMTWFTNRMRPCDPEISPVFGELAGLPPTLVHASEAEMLLDDARRYVNKARAAGSAATLETWHDMLHVWHAFESEVPEASEAFANIAEFLERSAPRHAEQAA